MNEQPTPRTDAESKRYNDEDIFEDRNTIPADFARTLERELAEAQEKLDIESMRERCTQCNIGWNPSLVESGWCIFCILEEKKTELTKASAQLAEAKEQLMQSQLPKNKEGLPKVLDSIIKIQNERDNALAQLTAAQKDKERLDWLEKHYNDWDKYITRDSDGWSYRKSAGTYIESTIRTAIDTAMNEKENK